MDLIKGINDAAVEQVEAATAKAEEETIAALAAENEGAGGKTIDDYLSDIKQRNK